MGLLGKLAEKVVDKLSGRNNDSRAPLAHAPRATPPARATPAAAPPTAPKAAPQATTGVPKAVAVTAGSEGPVADGEALARLDAGCQEVKERVEAGEPVVLLDVREPEETARGIIRGAILIPLSQLEARWKEVEKHNEIICYCAAGKRSLTAAQMLRDRGLFNATSLEGGLAAWTNLGGKVVRPPGA